MPRQHILRRLILLIYVNYLLPSLNQQSIVNTSLSTFESSIFIIFFHFKDSTFYCAFLVFEIRSFIVTIKYFQVPFRVHYHNCFLSTPQSGFSHSRISFCNLNAILFLFSLSPLLFQYSVQQEYPSSVQSQLH